MEPEIQSLRWICLSLKKMLQIKNVLFLSIFLKKKYLVNKEPWHSDIQLYGFPFCRFFLHKPDSCQWLVCAQLAPCCRIQSLVDHLCGFGGGGQFQWPIHCIYTVTLNQVWTCVGSPAHFFFCRKDLTLWHFEFALRPLKANRGQVNPLPKKSLTKWYGPQSRPCKQPAGVGVLSTVTQIEWHKMYPPLSKARPCPRYTPRSDRTFSHRRLRFALNFTPLVPRSDRIFFSPGRTLDKGGGYNLNGAQIRSLHHTNANFNIWFFLKSI